MAEKHLEDDDPYEFVAVRFPMEAGADGDEAMTRCFVEEYALMGMAPDKIFHIFRSPAFVGTHTVYETRGEAFVRRIIAEVFGTAPQEVA